jgi:hypothetical protein
MAGLPTLEIIAIDTWPTADYTHVLLIYELTPCNRVLLEKLIVA